ncbi:unnamed protein product [Ophioblennius macclurei]
MSNERNHEVVSCDASIMKNVWEIRVREYDQKLHQEKDRMEKSALASINMDWAGRLAARNGGYKRADPKPRQRIEIKTDDIWKGKEPLAVPRPAGPGPLGRPAPQNRSYSAASPASKEKKVQDKSVTKLQLILSIGQNQPSVMVWGKSWKYNKGVPPPAEGYPAGWGQCWMFVTQQPPSEEGKHWANGPNKMDPHSLQLWSKEDYRMMDSLDLDLELPHDEWEMSWRKRSKGGQKDGSENEEHYVDYGIFTRLVETQHHNEDMHSSEWSDSWRATKPSEEDHFTESADVSMNESEVSNNDLDSEVYSKWAECWKFVNYQGRNNVVMPKLNKHAPKEWLDSWRAAMAGFSNHKKVDAHDGSHTGNNHAKHHESHFHKILSLSYEPKYRDLCQQLSNELQGISEWSQSWQVPKNNAMPCEEMKKILEEFPPSMETASGTGSTNNKAKAHSAQPEVTDPFYEQLKHDVLYHPKRKLTQSVLFLLKNLEKMMPSSEWRDSWKQIKHRMRMERRRMRINPSQPFRESGDRMPTASEWKDSWKAPKHSLHQEPEMWRQGWPAMAPVRVDRAADQNHFRPVEHPKNGPSGEPGWNESWRFFRRQPGSQSGRAQTTQTTPDNVAHHHDHSQRRPRASSDWQPSWMVSENRFHHDNPSFAQWRNAWRCYTNHIHHWSAQQARESWVDRMMEIRPLRERVSLQRAIGKMSRSFESQMFRQRFPEKEWKPSWNAGPLFTHQTYHYGSSGVSEKTMSVSNQQQTVGSNQDGAKWGRSFRLANPMPEKEQYWTKFYSNPASYTVMWRRGKKTPVKVHLNFSNNPATFKAWVNAYRLLQGAGAQNNNKGKSHLPTDPRVIIPHQIKDKNHLFSGTQVDKQSEKKWAGCHLLGKTQPRPKKAVGSDKKMKHQNDADDKFNGEWAESWRFLMSTASLKKLKSVKSLTGWNESWKFLVPPYPTLNGPKTR